MTVLGSAVDSTVLGAIKSGKKHGKSVVADMIGVKDRVSRLKELKELGITWAELHAGLDEQAQPGYTIHNLLEIGKQAEIPFSIAGGVNLESIEAVEAAGAIVAVAGHYIYGAKNPAAAAKGLREKIHKLG
jgi:3-hexulose-6-phosphate synthase